MCKRTQHVTSNSVGQQCCVRLHAALQACGVHLQLKCQKKWLRSHLSKVLLHETIEARISQLTDSLFSFSRSLSARRKKKHGGFIYRKRKVWSVGGGSGFKMKNVCGEARLTFNLQIILYYTRGGEWFFKNSGSRKILVEFHGSRSLVFWAVMRVSPLE